MGPAGGRPGVGAGVTGTAGGLAGVDAGAVGTADGLSGVDADAVGPAGGLSRVGALAAGFGDGEQESADEIMSSDGELGKNELDLITFTITGSDSWGELYGSKAIKRM